MNFKKGCSRRCETICAKGIIDAETLIKLEALYEKLQMSDSESLLKKHLTREIYDRLKLRRTFYGSTLLDCIRPGLEQYDMRVGVYAADADAYRTFAELFDAIIEAYHVGFKKTDVHPLINWGDLDAFGDLDPEGAYIINTRIRCNRSLVGYPFNPMLTKQQFKDIEKKIYKALTKLPEELQGSYYRLRRSDPEMQAQLLGGHFLFDKRQRFLKSANTRRFWPIGRGIFSSKDYNFFVWVNEEVHLRIISMQEGGNLGEVYRRFIKGVCNMSKSLRFSIDRRVGYLNVSPTDLGTALRASVNIRVPHLARCIGKQENIAAAYHLNIKATEYDDVLDVSNRRRLGLTEFEAVKEMRDGAMQIMRTERLLQKYKERKAALEAANVADTEEENAVQ